MTEFTKELLLDIVKGNNDQFTVETRYGERISYGERVNGCELKCVFYDKNSKKYYKFYCYYFEFEREYFVPELSLEYMCEVKKEVEVEEVVKNGKVVSRTETISYVKVDKND